MLENKKYLSSGHNACAGCGELSAAQSVMRGLNDNVIIANATGCLEVTTTAYPQSAWGLPWIHSLFENASAVASGINAALKQKKNKQTKVIVFGGDGGTFDIGIGLISGMWERGENILYVCFDTESYSNTGFQASGATPYGASTSTAPHGLISPGSTTNKKDMIGVALAHGVKYIAQSTTGFPDDITNKVKKALAANGPAYIQILCPCIPGWKIKYDEAGTMAKMAVKTGLYPLLEYIDGQLVASSINSNFQPTSIKEYLTMQGRFSHLKENDLVMIKKIVDKNILKYKI